MSIPSDIRHSWDSITFGGGCSDCYFPGCEDEDMDDTFRLVKAVHKVACVTCQQLEFEVTNGEEAAGYCPALEALENEL